MLLQPGHLGVFYSIIFYFLGHVCQRQIIFSLSLDLKHTLSFPLTFSFAISALTLNNLCVLGHQGEAERGEHDQNKWREMYLFLTIIHSSTPSTHAVISPPHPTRMHTSTLNVYRFIGWILHFHSLIKFDLIHQGSKNAPEKGSFFNGLKNQSDSMWVGAVVEIMNDEFNKPILSP